MSARPAISRREQSAWDFSGRRLRLVKPGAEREEPSQFPDAAELEPSPLVDAILRYLASLP